MAGILNIDSFEYFFNEDALRKGLDLFQKNKFKEIEKLGGGDHVFHFKGKARPVLHLLKKGNKIIKYTCSCRRVKCEHLCAAIFHFSKDKLVPDERFISRINKLRTKNDQFPAYCKKLNILIKKYFRANLFEDGKEKNKKAFEVVKTFGIHAGKISPVMTHLAILSEFCNIFSYRKNLTEGINTGVISLSVDVLKDLKSKYFSDEEKNAWITATKNSLKSNKKFSSGVYAFLIPLAVKFIDDTRILEELKMLLHKRTQRQKYPHHLDMPQISKLQVLLKESELTETKTFPELRHLHPELSVAKAELQFCSNKISAGIKILLSDYEKIKRLRPVNFINYLEYLVNRTKELKQGKSELFFIKEIIICDHVISPESLKRLRLLMPLAQREKQINELIIELKKQQPEIYFDKLCQLLESENRLDELITEIDKQTNKFWLINKIAIKKLPHYDSFLLSVYKKHLISMLYEARESYHQKQIFEMAKVYFDQLPVEVAVKLTGGILEKISKNNFIYEYLKKYLAGFKESNTV